MRGLLLASALLLVGASAHKPAVPSLAKAKAAVADLFKDPGSAQFRKVEVARDTTGGRVICGEVNAKNGYGAYAGYERFAYSAALDEAELSSDPGADWLNLTSNCWK